MTTVTEVPEKLETLGIGDEHCGCSHMLGRQHRHVPAMIDGIEYIVVSLCEECPCSIPPIDRSVGGLWDFARSVTSVRGDADTGVRATSVREEANS
jgi:hypothetical protein